MIMRQEDTVRADVKGSAEEEAQIYGDLRCRPKSDLVVGKIAPVGRDKGRVQPFDRPLANGKAQIAPVIGVVGRYTRAADLFVERRTEQIARGQYRADNIGVFTKGCTELLVRGCKGTAKPAEMSDQPFGCCASPLAREWFEERRHDRYGPRCRLRRACAAMPRARISRVV